MTTDDRHIHTTPGAPPAGHDGIPQYEIRVGGRLGSRWTAWFDGLSLCEQPDGTTVIQGPLVDQAALHGVLQKLRDVGIPLVSVNPLPSDAPTTARTPRTQKGT